MGLKGLVNVLGESNEDLRSEEAQKLVEAGSILPPNSGVAARGRNSKNPLMEGEYD